MRDGGRTEDFGVPSPKRASDRGPPSSRSPLTPVPPVHRDGVRGVPKVPKLWLDRGGTCPAPWGSLGGPPIPWGWGLPAGRMQLGEGRPEALQVQAKGVSGVRPGAPRFLLCACMLARLQGGGGSGEGPECWGRPTGHPGRLRRSREPGDPGPVGRPGGGAGGWKGGRGLGTGVFSVSHGVPALQGLLRTGSGHPAWCALSLVWGTPPKKANQSPELQTPPPKIWSTPDSGSPVCASLLAPSLVLFPPKSCRVLASCWVLGSFPKTKPLFLWFPLVDNCTERLMDRAVSRASSAFCRGKG